MPEPSSISEFLQERGALGILTLLSMEDGLRFTDLENQLSISSSTLNRRLARARGLGLVVPGMDPEETSVNSEYRITTRGKGVVRQMEKQGLVHAVRTILDYQSKIDREIGGLCEWVEENEDKLASLDDQEPYQDAFGESLVNRDDPEYDDEHMIRENPNPGDRPDIRSEQQDDE